MIFLCYYNSKYFASEPFFIEEIEEFRGGKSESGKTKIFFNFFNFCYSKHENWITHFETLKTKKNER